MAENPLAKQLLAYVMQDEARHVAFGRLALRDAYKELSDKERSEREDFVVEGCWLMRNRFLGTEVYETLGMPVDECPEIAEHSEFQQMFRSLLFSRIVPCVKDIGLWGEKVQKCYAEMGVLDMAGVNLDKLMKDDEDKAELIDREKQEMAARVDEVNETIAVHEGGQTAERAGRPPPHRSQRSPPPNGARLEKRGGSWGAPPPEGPPSWRPRPGTVVGRRGGEPGG